MAEAVALVLQLAFRAGLNAAWSEKKSAARSAKLWQAAAQGDTGARPQPAPALGAGAAMQGRYVGGRPLPGPARLHPSRAPACPCPSSSQSAAPSAQGHPHRQRRRQRQHSLAPRRRGRPAGHGPGAAGGGGAAGRTQPGGADGTGCRRPSGQAGGARHARPVPAQRGGSCLLTWLEACERAEPAVRVAPLARHPLRPFAAILRACAAQHHSSSSLSTCTDQSHPSYSIERAMRLPRPFVLIRGQAGAVAEEGRGVHLRAVEERGGRRQRGGAGRRSGKLMPWHDLPDLPLHLHRHGGSRHGCLLDPAGRPCGGQPGGATVRQRGRAAGRPLPPSPACRGDFPASSAPCPRRWSAARALHRCSLAPRGLPASRTRR